MILFEDPQKKKQRHWHRENYKVILKWKGLAQDNRKKGHDTEDSGREESTLEESD